MLQITVPAGRIPPAFVPAGLPIQFPPGTVVSYDGGAWALYINKQMNKSWIAYALASGTKVVPMGGIRRVQIDYGLMDRFIKQRQAAGCSACDD